MEEIEIVEANGDGFMLGNPDAIPFIEEHNHEYEIVPGGAVGGFVNGKHVEYVLKYCTICGERKVFD